MKGKFQLSESLRRILAEAELKTLRELEFVSNQSDKRVKIIECPRDAMQGIKSFIPTENKAAYINSLLKVGFDTLDFGSFVSPKAIPQMRDTAELIKLLDMNHTSTNLLSIVGNMRGATEASDFDEITYLGYPFSISPTFLKRNLNTTIEASQKTVAELLDLCDKKKKQLVVYITMAFGNPYGDEWNLDVVAKWTHKLSEMGVRIIPLSDTIGSSNMLGIKEFFSNLVPAFPAVEIGLHLHTSLKDWYKKVDAAYTSGCKRFDSVLNGLGGCPMAEDGVLVGNLKTGKLLEYLKSKGERTNINEKAFLEAYMLAIETFPNSSLFQTDD